MHFSSLPITLSRCAKTFGQQRVLEPVDLSIAAGETLVLLGPSGCGKTTMLRMIAGLEQPDAGGRILFGEDDVTRLPIEKRQVGMVFQNYALFPNMTVRGNVAYGLRVKKMPVNQMRQRVDEMLTLTQLGAHADRPVTQLSGGQRQRVALARALAPQPRVLLLDEPLTALDAKLRDALRTEMNLLLRQLGVTAIYVTHDQAEAMALGDRIVVMSAGQVEQVGTPRDIYYKPANRTVADFIGTMNRITGQWRDGYFECAGGRLLMPDGAPECTEIFFRPEDGRLDTAPTASLMGRLDLAVFMGERTRLMLSGLGGEKDGVIQIDAPGRFDLTPGTSVGIAIAPQALMTL